MRWICFCLLFTTLKLTANDSVVMRQLLQRVAQLQPKQGGVFPKGSIPSYRLYALNKDRLKADVNAFFTGLVVFTLKDIKRELPVDQQRIANGIIADALPVFDKFKSRKGRSTYNFWPTDTPRIFPNSGWLNLFDKSQQLPDDLDDTVIMLLAENADSSTAKAVHELMQGYINNPSKKVHNTFKDYRGIGAYSTWFGQKMPVDFDICVLSNVLYFVQAYNLRWTAADSASLVLIEKILADRKHVSAAGYVSPHYSKLPNILYHLSRLMALKPIPSLERFRPQLIEDAKNALLNADTFMDEVILSTALLRWGVDPPALKPRMANSLQELVEEEKFSFFIANMAAMLPDPLKQWMGGAGVGKFYYFAPAYNNVLLLENLVWRQRRGLSL
ncbi:MAG: hypothetical protein JO301_17445 [Chitinophagaceae bacterium]|nr:hypothetical protein [Chitinophagaceae bacterium]